MTCMRGQLFTNLLVASRTQRVVARRELRVLVDVRQMGVLVTAGARRAAPQEALTLPQADGVIRKAARAAVGPVARILILARPVLEQRLEKVVIVGAGRV